MKKFLMGLSSIVILLLSGCSNESSETISTTNQYDLRTFFDTGSVSAEGEGMLTDSSDLVNAIGSYQKIYLGTSILTSGETIHNHDINIKVTGGETTLSKSTYSASYMGNFFSINTGVYSCTSTLPLSELTPLPTDAEIGYTSNEVRLDCDNGTYMRNVIRLMDGEEGNAVISVNYDTYSSSDGTLLATETEKIEVDSSTVIEDMEISAKLFSDEVVYTLTVKGTGPGGGGGGGGNLSPIANAGIDQSVIVGESVILDGSESYDPENSDLTYSWTLTDKPVGSIADITLKTSSITSFTADLIGVYTVELVVNDGRKNSIADKVIITASSGSGNISPIANAGPDKNVEVNNVVTIVGSGTDIDGTITSYSWTKNGIEIATTASFDYTPTAVDTDILTLTVTDDDGATAFDSMNVIVQEASSGNQTPVANAGVDLYVQVSDEVKLNGSGSTDADGDSLTYNWSFTSKPVGSNATLSRTTAKRPTFVVDVEGTYVISLVVNDGTVDSSPDSVSVATNILSNIAPTADAGPDTSTKVNTEITITGSGSDLDGTIASYSWTKNGVEIATTASFDYTPTVVGTQLFTLTVRDNEGATGSDSMQLIVESTSSTSKTFTNNTDLPIPDCLINDCPVVESEINVSGANTLVEKVTISLNLYHTRIYSVNIKLVSPSGTSIVLSDPGIDYAIVSESASRYCDTVFDDEAQVSIIDATPVNDPASGCYSGIMGTYSPEEELSAFKGEDSNGIWILQVHNRVWTEVGTLYSWSITIE